MKLTSFTRVVWLLLVSLSLNFYLFSTCPFNKPKGLPDTSLERLINLVQDDLLATEQLLPHKSCPCGLENHSLLNSYEAVANDWVTVHDELSSSYPCRESGPVELLQIAQNAYFRGCTKAQKGKPLKAFRAFMQAFLSLECLQNALQASNYANINTAEYESVITPKKWDLFNQLGEFYNNFDTNPYFSKSEKKAMTPYILPVDHPAKEALDSLCKNERVTATKDSLAAAGFLAKDAQPRSFITVAGHYLMPGYLIKVYTDDEFRMKAATPGWKWLERRIKGAEKIRQLINSHKLTKFSVPFKWIYPLPPKPNPPKYLKAGRKNEILVVEDMNLTSRDENFSAWYYKITEAHLKEFFIIVSFAGGSSYWPRNVAYTKNGQFAFIDTEYPYKAADYSTIDKHLAPPMRSYWKRLTGRG